MKKLKAYLLVGIPGSGKSTWGQNAAQANPDFVRLCPDEFRAKFGTGEADQSVSGRAFAATKHGMDVALRDGHSVIIDATNMYRKTRKDFLDIAKKYNAETIAVVFEVSRETAIERNKNRGAAGGRNVPEHVIDSMLSKYQVPDNTEFDEVKFITKL